MPWASSLRLSQVGSVSVGRWGLTAAAMPPAPTRTCTTARSPLVNSPEVQDAIATTVIDAIEKQVDVEAIINDVFAGVITDRARLERLVGPLAGAVNGLIESQVRQFIASDAFADLWVRINTKAQQGLVRVLKGEAADDRGARPCARTVRG